jgi:hypothetical protein
MCTMAGINNRELYMQGSVLFHKRVVHNKYYLSWEYFKYFKSENRFYILPNKQNRIGFDQICIFVH